MKEKKKGRETRRERRREGGEKGREIPVELDLPIPSLIREWKGTWQRAFRGKVHPFTATNKSSTI